MKKLNFFNEYHNSSKRNYLSRMNANKPKFMVLSKKYSYDYWDGSRKTGYGGYNFIENYWDKMAKNIIKKFKLKNNSKILDIGCGKGYLLQAIFKENPNIKIFGCDVSKYALKNSHKEVKKNLFYHDIRKKTKFKKKYFDLVISFNCLHNLEIFDLDFSIKEINRIARNSYIVVESYRNERELFNLQCWALTANTFLSDKEWAYYLKKLEYNGYYELILFK